MRELIRRYGFDHEKVAKTKTAAPRDRRLSSHTLETRV